MILPSTILEFTWLVIDGFVETGQAILSQKGNSVPSLQTVSKKFDIFLAAGYKIQKQFLALTKKKYLWVGGGAYTMENETEIQTTRKLLG